MNPDKTRFISDYEKAELPSYEKSTEVKMTLHVKDLYGLSENTMDFSVHCYFHLYWLDERLQVRKRLFSTPNTSYFRPKFFGIHGPSHISKKLLRVGYPTYISCTPRVGAGFWNCSSQNGA